MFNNKKKDLPDICIGYNEREDSLSKLCVDYFTNLHYVVKTNYPYSGAIIPNSLISKPNSNVKSVMIELNKDIYMKDKKKYLKLQKEINELLNIIEKTNFD